MENTNYNSFSAFDNSHPMMNDGMMLEPRLQEYMKLAKHYKTNNIKPSVSVEKTFQITRDDIATIKRFVRGVREGHNLEEQRDQRDQRDDDIEGFDGSVKGSFPSKSFRDSDPRVPYVSNVRHDKKIKNFGMFAPDPNEGFYHVDAFTDDKVLIDARDINVDINFDPRIDPQIAQTNNSCNDFSTKFDKTKSMYKVDDPNSMRCRTYDSPAKKNASDKRMKDTRKIFGLGMNAGTRGGNGINNMGSSTFGAYQSDDFGGMSEIDVSNGMVIPNVGCNGKKVNCDNNYMLQHSVEPLRQNFDEEADMMRGIPSSTSKSYGYRNPFEHYMQFIDPKLVIPNGDALMINQGGLNTRDYNKTTSKYERQFHA